MSNVKKSETFLNRKDSSLPFLAYFGHSPYFCLSEITMIDSVMIYPSFRPKRNAGLIHKYSQSLLRLFMLPVMMFLPLLLPVAADSQTHRVSVGFSSDGYRQYIEVYEYDFVEIKPAFPGGDSKLVEYINSKRKYPKTAYTKGIQGRVTCSFIINKDGSVSNIAILKSVEETLNSEAVRIFREMPNWTPGQHKGTPVPVRVIRSVPFRI